MDRHNKIKVIHTLELLKNVADMFIGVHLVGLSKRLLKYDFGESMLGMAGTVSSLIGLYQVHF